MKIAPRALSALLLCMPCAYAASYTYQMKVTPETITLYKKSIGPFVHKRKKQNGLLNTGIGGFFASLSGVDVKEARAFLGRAFEDQLALDSAIYTLDQNPVCIAYIQKIIHELTPSDIRRKSSKKFPELMRKYKYPGYNGSETPWIKQDVTDKEFYNGAACSFMIYHLVESDGPARIKISVKK